MHGFANLSLCYLAFCHYSPRSRFFNIAFFFENFVFIACYLLSLFVALIRKPFSFSAETASGDDEDDSDYDLDFDPERRCVCVCVCGS